MRKTHKIALFFSVPIAWAIVILANSLKPGDLSQGMSDPIAQVFHKIITSWGMDISIDTASFVVRKAAHGLEFMLFAGLLALCFAYFQYKPKQYIVNVLFAGLALAVADETVQMFVVGRSSEVRDVLVDFSGVIIGVIVVVLCHIIYLSRRKKRCTIK